MKKNYTLLFLIVSLVLIITGCKTKTAVYPTADLSDYFQLQPGKYVTYRLDSTEFISFGTVTIVASYQARDIVDTLITDNLGRPSWRVIRYLSDTTGTAPWTPVETYLVTVTHQDVEVVENNLRFIKLTAPIVNGNNWSGNSYINTLAPSDPLNDPDFSYLDSWDYTYDSVGSPYVTFGGTVDNSITVKQRDDVIGDFSDVTRYSERNYSEEVYGKGIGLIYKNFLHQAYQPPNGGTAVGSTSGYGIRLNMIDHN